MRPALVRHARHGASLLCAAALGSLLFSVHVATMLFRELSDDRLRAGRIAGRTFVGAYWIAAVAGVAAIAAAFATRAPRLDRLMAVILVAIAALQLTWIAPAIGSHGSGWPGSFASLHATGGVLHVALAALALALAWRLLADPPDQRF